MKLIVGLGNPGQDYTNTRHNLGFIIIDKLVNEMKVNLSFDKKLKAEIAMFVRNDETLILAKPQTFMNLSGDCVAKIANFYKIELGDIWVISDDLDLEYGKIRMRQGGSSGGHNGLKDIIAKLGEGFVRIRVGIKNNDLDKIAADKFVLQNFSTQEQTQLDTIVQTATTLVMNGLKDGIEHSSHQTQIDQQ